MVNLFSKINKLKKEKNAIILAHNYQKPEIYKVADYIGDSYGLSKKATETDANIIVFCGVDFMAETAKVLNPEKKVLLPVREAKCPLAAMISREGLIEMKKNYPNTAVVSYINASAEIKAESDACCTSANCVEVINSLPEKEVIFVPDEHLANYVQTKTNKKIIPWKGYCYVHVKFSADRIKKAKELHPNAKVVAHPECRMDVIELADYVGSTSQMIPFVREDNAKEFIIATEVGLVERLKLLMPEKKFYTTCSTCIQQKKVNLPAVLRSLQKEIYPVELDEKIIRKARKALEKMLEVSRKMD